MMAIDMGGSINKAAYVFGTGVLATASQMIEKVHSQATRLFRHVTLPWQRSWSVVWFLRSESRLPASSSRKKFTKEERGSKVSNFVMGASFITEGAIPFAAADPLHVIPCTLIGAGVAGFYPHCLSAH